MERDSSFYFLSTGLNIQGILIATLFFLMMFTELGENSDFLIFSIFISIIVSCITIGMVTMSNSKLSFAPTWLVNIVMILLTVAAIVVPKLLR